MKHKSVTDQFWRVTTTRLHCSLGFIDCDTHRRAAEVAEELNASIVMRRRGWCPLKIGELGWGVNDASWRALAAEIDLESLHKFARALANVIEKTPAKALLKANAEYEKLFCDK
jgi:hypothetical protein